MEVYFVKHCVTRRKCNIENGYLEIYHKEWDRVEYSRSSVSKVGEGVLIERFKFNMEVIYMGLLPLLNSWWTLYLYDRHWSSQGWAILLILLSLSLQLNSWRAGDHMPCHVSQYAVGTYSIKCWYLQVFLFFFTSISLM